MSDKEAWRSKAKRVLDRYERGVIKTLTQSELAKMSGVSRQTLWRDKGLREHFHRLQELRGSNTKSSVVRANSEMRIRTLLAENARLQHENGLLIQNTVAICRKLREHGLDPHIFVAEAAEDIKLLSVRSLDE